MSIAAPALKLENMTINIYEEIRVKAPIATTFKAVLDQLGPYNETPEGRSLAMKLEEWPGGRWYRDLGDGNGHYWGTVQAIKRPALIEICGPLFMSNPVISNLQYRLSEEAGGTLIKFHHTAMGWILDEYRNAKQGWAHMHKMIGARAESSRPH